jgi:hypothetical protein
MFKFKNTTAIILTIAENYRGGAKIVCMEWGVGWR